jgi:NAD-dependent dihydropyrimidine dehydrogenase PreA subunit
MAFVVTSACIGTKDRSCVEVCPVACIHDDGADDEMLYIDPIACINCRACEPACPVGAIFEDNLLPEDQRHFEEINALWFTDKAAARARIAAFTRSGG